MEIIRRFIVWSQSEFFRVEFVRIVAGNFRHEPCKKARVVAHVGAHNSTELNSYARLHMCSFLKELSHHSKIIHAIGDVSHTNNIAHCQTSAICAASVVDKCALRFVFIRWPWSMRLEGMRPSIRCLWRFLSRRIVDTKGALSESCSQLSSTSLALLHCDRDPSEVS